MSHMLVNIIQKCTLAPSSQLKRQLQISKQVPTVPYHQTGSNVICVLVGVGGLNGTARSARIAVMHI